MIARGLGPGVGTGAEREQRRLPHIAGVAVMDRHGPRREYGPAAKTPFADWGGVPLLVVPDNTRTGVSKACRYDPDVNPTYQNFAAHYGFGVLPARPYKPRDKAVVENAVQVAQRWILAALRHRKFFSLVEANQSIGELLHRLNHRPFRKRDGSRASVFEALDKPALQPLPSERFEISEWARARVNIDYHVAFDGNFYSVPYNLVQQVVEVRATVTTVEILHQSVRVASHVRSRGRGIAITNREHRPKSHQAHLEWPPSRITRVPISRSTTFPLLKALGVASLGAGKRI